MKAATERSIIRWFHILASIPVMGFIYGPVSTIPRAAFAVRWVIFPLIVLSGLWLWKGHLIKKHLRKKSSYNRMVGGLRNSRGGPEKSTEASINAAEIKMK
jgi:hypothetical protein